MQEKEERLVLGKQDDPLLINYLMLAQAIIFSDYDDGQDYCVCVYDTKENDRLVAVFNNDATCGRFFRTSKNVIQNQRSREQLINWRFRTERFKCGTTSSSAEFYKIMINEGNKKEMDYIRKRLGR